MDAPKDLPDIRNHLFDKAEGLWRWSLYLSVAIQIVLFIAVISNNPKIIFISGFIGLLAPLIITWIRVIASNIKNNADKCRRLILYSDGLGKDIPPDEMVTIKSWTIGSQIGEAPYTPPFYASKLEPGPARLMDITAESAFFTSKLAGKVSSILKALLAAVVLILLTITYFGLARTGSSKIGEIILVTASFLLGGDFYLLLKNYSDLERESNSIFEKCAKMRLDSALEMYEAMQTIEDYHLFLIQGPPIPSKIYFKHVDSLNSIYKDMIGTGHENESG